MTFQKSAKTQVVLSFAIFIYKHFQVMQVHINEAIEEVNKIVKKFLTPSNELKKTIYVLDQPPL